MICPWMWSWLAVDVDVHKVSTGKWTSKEIQRRVFFSVFARYEPSTVEVRRLCCLEEVAARCKYQQVDWQRASTTFCHYHVHVMKPVLVQKRRRCSASQVADF